MRLALIYSAYPPIEEISRGDGGADYCRQLVEQLASRGYEIDVITSSWSEACSPEERGTQHPNGVRVHRVVREWGLRGLCCGEYKALRRRLEALDPAAILVVFPGGGLGCRYLLPTLTKFACPSKPVITILFAFLVRKAFFYLPLFLCAEAALLASSSKICFESLDQMARLGRMVPFLGSRLAYIPPGAPWNFSLRERSQSQAELRGKLGLDLETKYVAFLGSFRPNKNVELFLRSTVRVLDRLPRTAILFIGGRDRERMKSRYERRMLRLIQRLGLKSTVRFTGYVNQSTFASYLYATDLCVLPFDARMGRSTLSIAMAAGKPIVTISRGEHPLLRHRETAWLVKGCDPQRLAQAIENVLRDGDLRKRLSRGSLDASKQVSWEQLALQWHSLIQEVLVLQGAAPARTNCSSGIRDVPASVEHPSEFARDALGARGAPRRLT